MLKLAFCITELNIGGAERMMCELAVRLDPKKFSVTIYSLQSRPENDAASCVPMLEEAGISVRFLNIKGLTSIPVAFFRLRTYLKKQQPDVFLSFLFHANLLGRFAAYSAGIQHVISGIRVAEKQARWHLFFDRWTNKLVEKYVCVSQSVAAYSRLAGRLPNEKIVVIPNGIDCEQIQKTLTTVSPILPQGNRILFVGRLTQQKGLDWLLESADKWLLKLPGWKLWIVGDGEERSRLEKMLQESSLQKQVKFLGWRSDVAELLAVSKILILPSRWEGMPNVILQAMAAGLPVVTTEVEGIAELLGENAAEQTCRFGDSEILSKRILTLATDSDFAEQLGNKNRQRAEELFSIDSIVRQYEDFFSAIQKL